MTEYCGTLSWHNNVIDKIVKKQIGPLKFIGVNIEQNGSEIHVNQQADINGHKEIQIDNI